MGCSSEQLQLRVFEGDEEAGKGKWIQLTLFTPEVNPSHSLHTGSG